MAKTIGIIGTLDTKWPESSYVKKEIWCSEADQAFVDALRKSLRPDIPLEVSEKAVNDPEFSSPCC